MGQSERKQREQEIRKKDILDAAERVFFSKGYEHASMDEVAKEAEFSKRTIYVYFSSKEQIYFEIMIRGYQLLLHMIKEDFLDKRPKKALDELRCIFFTFYQFSQLYPMYYKAIMKYETKNADVDFCVEGESKKICYELGEQLLDYLCRALQKGVQEGSLRNNLDSKESALMLWACTIGIFNTSDIKQNYLLEYQQIQPKEFVTHYFDMLMGFISRKEGS